MSYNEIKNEIKAAPKTWLPGLLVCVVKTSLQKKVFKPGGAARVAKEVEDEAQNNAALSPAQPRSHATQTPNRPDGE